MTTHAAVIAGVLFLATAAPAAAQRVPFERLYDVGPNAALDVTTTNGKIDVIVGDPGRMRVEGTATVRLGLNVPVDAVAIARRLAANPPIQLEGGTLRLRPPATDEERRAVTLSYQVTVPCDVQVRIATDSGATSVRGVGGEVAVKTQSAAILLRDLGGVADVSTGSGAVTIDGVAGNLSVFTQSSGITLTSLGAGLRVRTQSGAVRARFVGEGDVDVETGSSAIALDNIRGGLRVSSNSGRIDVSGDPISPWQITKGSGGVDVDFLPGAKLTLDVDGGSGKVAVDGLTVDGAASEHRIAGAVNGGGPLVRVSGRSGSIRLR
jgi:DUF4097 and DUF4098 domain-containing protein YvlB